MTEPQVWPPAHVEVHGSVAAVDPDLELLEAWRGGDRQAAGEILDRYYKLIRCTVATKVPDSDVDDLVQKVVMALYEGRERFRADAKLKTYAMRVTRNVIADYFRRRRPTTPLDVLGSSARELGAGPSSLIIEQEKHRLLLEALRSVSLDDQLILELHYWEKMTGPQLAQVFECPEPAIRSRVRRAKVRLREQLEKLAEDHQEFADTTTDLDAWARQLREAIEPRLRHMKRKVIDDQK
jgi:RNA polymerase sigma factor (sigma-70 family)